MTLILLVACMRVSTSVASVGGSSVTLILLVACMRVSTSVAIVGGAV